MSKRDELEKLKKEMEEDKSLPLRAEATQLVFGEGNPNAEIYLLGEAPGYWEDKEGKPFVGQAGRLLDNLLGSIGIKREDVYISNIVRFRPPNNRDPLPREIKAFEAYVDREIEIINPKIIVTLGRWSLGKFLPDVVISKVHGNPKTIIWRGKDLKVLPMYHPAAALRRGEILAELKEDFKKIPKVLENLKQAQQLSF